MRQSPAVWARVDDDFYVCTVDDAVLGYAQRQRNGFASFDERSTALGSFDSLTDAMDAVVRLRGLGRGATAQRPGGPLYALVYSSLATVEFDDRGLEELLQRSRVANAGNDITGILLYRAGRFVQYLEGSRSSVTALMASIAADPRHDSVRVLVEGTAEDRQFSDWTMGFERLSAASADLPEGFRDSFDDLEGDESNGMLRAIREFSFWFRVRNAA